MSHVKVFLVPAQHFQFHFVTLEDVQGFLVGHGVLGDDRYPAALEHRFQQTAARKHIHAIEIADGQVAAVVHVKVDVDVVGQHAQRERARIVPVVQPLHEEGADDDPQHAEDQVHFKSQSTQGQGGKVEATKT